MFHRFLAPLNRLQWPCILLTVQRSYVGTLHEINPEASTIALENVVSFGTEGRRGKPEDELPPAPHIYEYIVFRGSDVKDISVAEDKKEDAPQEPQQVPDDPAILGVSRTTISEILPIVVARVSSPPTFAVGKDDLMMNYFGCKHRPVPNSAKTVWRFPLPSF
ncbi:unnamed protein product [Aspergillus oryzae var. brunneus]|uniref:Unnamed protein product n=2 Tax=Aspergillus oryzae TaxID=5062 RepID=A0AAN4YGZ6_ASPOZ|nr:unnamed protein product [Aspergillus oryzae]GMG29731.1 unnamed protein product [Aspergillus oryzae]GMG46139.1 unnamed protein product [Aspergillus oryzae var. brunneus]